MKKMLKKFYNSRSYQGKLKILFYIVFLIVALLLVIVGGFFVRMLSEEIYSHNQEKLTILSLNVESKLKDIEEIPTEFHQSILLQNALEKSSNENISNLDKLDIRSNIANELNWMMADKVDVKSIILLNKNYEQLSGNIYDEDQFLENYSFEDITGSISQTFNSGNWFFDKSLHGAVFIQNIFSTRGSSHMERIGTVVVSVNTSFIQNFLNESKIFSDKDFFVLEYGDKLHSSNWDNYDDFSSFIKKYQQSLNPYEFVTVNNTKFFVMSTNAEVGKNDFKFYYFILNRQLVEKLIQVGIIFSLIIGLIFFLSIWLGTRYLSNLISPINYLATTMKRFNGEADFKNLKEISEPSMILARTDEIGVLYASFQQLIHEIEELVIKDYQSKLSTQEIEYKFLQAQLDPHFLYNTLNSINWLALSKGDMEISEMVTSLALLFRNKVDNSSSFETVAESIEVVEAYLKIQTIRFKSRLIFEYSIDPMTTDFSIPRLIIQPVIENAVKYGVEKLNRPVHIELKIVIKDGRLLISVIDDGPGFQHSPNNERNSTGLGLENIRTRIQLIYGKTALINIDTKENNGAIVTIILPVNQLSNIYREGEKKNG